MCSIVKHNVAVTQCRAAGLLNVTCILLRDWSEMNMFWQKLWVDKSIQGGGDRFGQC